MKESRHVNFGAIHAIFLQLSCSHHKLAHSCQGRGQRSNGAINRNKQTNICFRMVAMALRISPKADDVMTVLSTVAQRYKHVTTVYILWWPSGTNTSLLYIYYGGPAVQIRHYCIYTTVAQRYKHVTTVYILRWPSGTNTSLLYTTVAQRYKHVTTVYILRWPSGTNTSLLYIYYGGPAVQTRHYCIYTTVAQRYKYVTTVYYGGPAVQTRHYCIHTMVAQRYKHVTTVYILPWPSGTNTSLLYTTVAQRYKHVTTVYILRWPSGTITSPLYTTVAQRYKYVTTVYYGGPAVQTRHYCILRWPSGTNTSLLYTTWIPLHTTTQILIVPTGLQKPPHGDQRSRKGATIRILKRGVEVFRM